jgi:hypothetical protein
MCEKSQRALFVPSLIDGILKAIEMTTLVNVVYCCPSRSLP